MKISACQGLSAPPFNTRCHCHPDRNPDGEFSHRDAFGAVGMEWRDLLDMARINNREILFFVNPMNEEISLRRALFLYTK